MGLFARKRDRPPKKAKGQDLARRLERFSLDLAARMIVNLDLIDHATALHSAQVAELSRALAERLGFPEGKQEETRVAGLLHDLGKTSVPDEILHFPGELSAEDAAVLKSHTEAGSKILGNMRDVPILAQVAAQHHEHWNGTGYPAGLRREAIIPEARIVAVADAVAKMSTDMPFRPALSHEAVVAELEAGRGTLYDPAVVDACLDLIREGG